MFEVSIFLELLLIVKDEIDLISFYNWLQSNIVEVVKVYIVLYKRDFLLMEMIMKINEW